MKKYLVIAMSLTTGEIFQEEVPARSVRLCPSFVCNRNFDLKTERRI